ncbi:alpha/beta hydrolase family protein [Rhabdochlamydiaceae symbiont of Dictyostelium giganteum]|uniref:alpha/beta hydrolase family protein n=1 Tax=Rhabdochlamydiaceae symbiont of Dictyostelium giganteum TaxID=3342349 RepID=UPI00384E4A70
MKRKILYLSLAAVAIGCLIGLSCCQKPCSLDRVLHPSKTGITTVRFYDEARERPLVTEIWYPVDQATTAAKVEGLWVRCAEARDAPLKTSSKKYPLIVMSHGNWGDRMNTSWIAETLAANGYIVAAVDHYGNTWNNKIVDSFIKIWERPKDISSVIDNLFQMEQFKDHIDAQRIGFVGYSLGGQTGVWIAGGRVAHFDQPDMSKLPADQIPTTVNEEVLRAIDFSPAANSYRDPRVSAAFLMAPALGYLFDGASLQSISIPVYIVAAEGDQTVPFDSSPKILAGKIKKAVLSLIPGSASHYVFLNEVSKGGKMLLDKKVAFDSPTVDRSKIHDEIATSAISFFAEHLK